MKVLEISTGSCESRQSKLIGKIEFSSHFFKATNINTIHIMKGGPGLLSNI